ncbi:MAG: DUF115 domain-containing protein [Bacteroidales bacterium]|nr:DUF115 domain-containing protein [Bacteroidales bacterium]
MKQIDKYFKFMKFKSHFKNIPILSSVIKKLKWKYYRPWYTEKWTEEHKKDFKLKTEGKREWTHNDQALLALKNSHKGETAFIIGNGPSLRAEDLNILQEKGIYCFAMNRINLIFDKTLWRPSCYVAIDRQMLRDGDTALQSVLQENIPLYLLADVLYEGVQNPSSNVLYFYNQPNSRYVPVHEFSSNIMEYVVDGFTVTYNAMQIAYYMGFSTVYLLGVDFNYSNVTNIDGTITKKTSNATYFDKQYDANSKNSGFMEGMLSAYKTANEFCKKNNFKIINLTRGGKLDAFERHNFDSIINQL